MKNPNLFALSMTLYVTPPTGAVLVFPFHKITVEILAQSQAKADSPEWLTLKSATAKQVDYRMIFSRARDQPAPVNVTTGLETIDATQDDITLRGPGKISVRADCRSLENDPPLIDIQVSLTLVETVSQTKVPIVCAGRLIDAGLRPLVWKLSAQGQ